MLRVSHVRCSWVATCQGGGKGIIIDNGYPILLRDPISCMPITRDQDSALGEREEVHISLCNHADMHMSFCQRPIRFIQMYVRLH